MDSGEPVQTCREFAFDATRHQSQLRIIATSDLHHHILPFDYLTGRADASVGLAAAAVRIRALRGKVRNALLFDNGDFLQGTPLSDTVAARAADDGRIHPFIAAMNAAGYDAGTLGNHEFNFGLDFLLRSLRGAAFPIVCCNVARVDGGPLCPPFVVLDRSIVMADGAHEPIRIGVIGFAPPQISQWDSVTLGGAVVTTEIVAAARRHLPALRAAGADLVIALCHSGFGPAEPAPAMENAAVSLAALGGIDAVLAGHTHQVFPGQGPWDPAVDPENGTICGVPAVMPGANGSHLGVIDLHLDRSASGWAVTGHCVCLDGPGDADPPRAVIRTDPAISRMGTALHAQVVREQRQTVGQTAQAIHSHFARLRADRSLQLVADAQCAAARPIIAALGLGHLPVLSAVAPFNCGGQTGRQGAVSIPPGPISRRNLDELYPFPNGLSILRLRMAAVADWLERSASQFRTLRADDPDQPLFDPDFPPYCADTLFGLDYRIDPTLPPRFSAAGDVIARSNRRVGQMLIAGLPADPAQEVIVLTNSFRASGGGGYHAAKAGRILHSTTEPLRDLIAAHLGRGTIEMAAPAAGWSFAPAPGVTAVFDAAGAAAAHLDQLPDRRLSVAGRPAPGTVRLRLHL